MELQFSLEHLEFINTGCTIINTAMSFFEYCVKMSGQSIIIIL